MAGRAVLGDGCVTPLERKPGFRRMIKILGVEGTEINVDALMFLMAGLAVAADVSVDAFFRGDPRGDRLMAGEAAPRIDLSSRLVAFLAVGRALERAVSFGKRAGRLGELLLLAPGRDRPECEEAESRRG